MITSDYSKNKRCIKRLNQLYPMNIYIHILSNQTLYAEALKSLLKEEDKTMEVAIYSLKNTFLESIENPSRPDIVLLDAHTTNKSIWDLLSNIKVQSPTTRVIMFANSNEVIYREYALKFGARGYVLKSSPKELLIAAIKIVMKGGQFFDPSVQDSNIQESRTGIKEKYKLSNRETEIISLIKDGLSTKDIANHLHLSFHTIESHRKNIYNKLNIHKIADLLKLHREFD